ncbi:TonB-dependent receptor [Pedobacter sp. BS3]|uniref:SusC/RagA family TonB-linked outer membrane protein n=1 Tax=Pedobacter sp. BS3 TaxID=2567937 RepID=UPI0011EF7A77|nr:TonB-dependent receptor [Pedobacter sp. BS3]TZF83278.1 TonB-dependent receptor [Pedobacter sp. BS3]
MLKYFNNLKMKLIAIRYITSFMLCLLLTAHVSAQSGDVTISGNVTDAAGKPLGNVDVQVQEKTQGLLTDNEGKFSITCSGNDMLVFKKSGYNTVYKAAFEVKTANSVVLPKSLTEAGDNDNVYIPFGVRKKREVTATISTITADELPQLPVSTLNNALTGRLPGLLIQQTGNRPGTDDANFLIRGRSSYNSGQSPLVLVDGVARDFVDMDVNEIESISVLKDAGSLSWYGMNGANGVIYVTTKRGSASATRVTFDAQGGVLVPVTMTNPLNSYGYAFLYNEARQNDGQSPLYSQADLIGYYTHSDPYTYPDNDFPKQFLKSASPVQRYVASISGGNAFARYFTLVSFYDQDGLYKGGDNANYNSNTNFKRYNFRTNLDLHINKSLDVALDVGGRVANLRYPRDGNVNFLNTIFTTPSNAFAVLNANGTYGGSSLFRSNPLAMLEARGNITDLYRTLLATVNVTQKLDAITKGLSLNLFYTYDMTGLYTSGFTQNYEVYELVSPGTYTRFGTQTPLDYAASTFSGNLRNNEFWGGLDYNRTFGKHGFKFSTRVQRAVSSASSRLDDKREGISNRLSYNYNQRYFADVIATYAGSQNFMPGKRFGWFPAVSAGWVISDENFLKPVKFLDYLKIRGSYGLVGNDAVSASRRFAFNNYYTRGGSQYFFGTGFSTVPNTAELDLANPDLTWEKAKKASIGFDTRFLKQAFSLSADYFHETRSDLLTADLSPGIIGQSLVQINAGKARYQGVEGALSYTKTLNKVTFGVYGNYTYVKSKILALNEEGGLPGYQRQVGFPIGGVDFSGTPIRKFLVAEGLFQTDEEIAAAPVQRFSGNVKPGDIRYKDINNDGVIDNLDFVSTSYSNIPTSYFGFGGSVKYAGFDMSFLFQGVAGRTIQISTLVNAGTSSTGYINQFSAYRWTPATAETAQYPRLTINDRSNNTANSDFWLRSGDFIKLKNVELGYTLPAGITKRLKLSNWRFYVSGFNLLTFDKLGNLPIDPEIPEAGFNSSYPYLATFALGMNLKF